jgi:hypothetical protein
VRHLYRSLRIDPAVPSRYRASHRRLRAIRLHDSWSREFWLFIAGLIIISVLVATGVLEHPPHHSAPPTHRQAK